MSSFGRSVGGSVGSQDVTSTSLGLNGGPGLNHAIIGPVPEVAYRGNVPDPNRGSTSQGAATAARFPALAGRPQAAATGAARRQQTRGQW